MSRQIPIAARKLLHLLYFEVQAESVVQGTDDADRLMVSADRLLAEYPDLIDDMREDLAALWAHHQHVPSITVTIDELLRAHTNRRLESKVQRPRYH
jgi:hypothetical protein